MKYVIELKKKILREKSKEKYGKQQERQRKENTLH